MPVCLLRKDRKGVDSDGKGGGKKTGRNRETGNLNQNIPYKKNYPLNNRKTLT